MAINEQIPRDQWADYFITFSNGNRGRAVSLEVLDNDAGDSGVRQLGPLLGVHYDPVGKGNDIVVTTGKDDVDYSHTIGAPVQIWQAQHDSGQVASLEFIDENNVKTVLSFD